jgi:hypothetical protein
VAVYIYPDAEPGDCTVYIAGRLAVHPLTGESIPFSTNPASEQFKDIPNILWKVVVPVVVNKVSTAPILFKSDPVITFRERKETYKSVPRSLRAVTKVAGTTGRVSIQSVQRPFQYGSDATFRTETVDSGKRHEVLATISGSSGISTPSTKLPEHSPLTVLKTTNFPLSASMVGGTITVNNIALTGYLPGDAVDPTVFNTVPAYSASIVRVLNNETAEVDTPFYHKVTYTTTAGAEREVVFSKFVGQSSFTASYAESLPIVASSRTESFLALDIKNLEPAVGTVDSIQVSYKAVGSIGDYTPVGQFKIKEQNLLTDTTEFVMTTDDGLVEVPIGFPRTQANVQSYWTASGVGVSGVALYHTESKVSEGIFIRHSGSNSETVYAVMSTSNKFNSVKNTEYGITFQTYNAPDGATTPLLPQLDVYMSGSSVVSDRVRTPVEYEPLRKASFGTYVGSVTAKNGAIQTSKLNFIADSEATLSPVFVVRGGLWHVGKIAVTPRHEQGFSTNHAKLNIPIDRLARGTELVLNIEYLNAEQTTANVTTKLHGLYFTGSHDPHTQVKDGPLNIWTEGTGRSSKATFIQNMVVTASLAATTTFSAVFPIAKLTRDPLTSTEVLKHSGSSTVGAVVYRVTTVVLGVTGSLLSPANTYVWSGEVLGRLLTTSKDGATPIVLASTNVGTHGASTGVKPNIDSQFGYIGTTVSASGDILINYRLTPSAGRWDMYVTNTCEVIKYEYELGVVG